MNSKSKIDRMITSIDNLFIENREQRLKQKIAENIKNSIFTDQILNVINEHDFSEVYEEENNLVKMFDSIFPIFIKKDEAIFRLYKHKIEVDLSDDMKDRFIFMFNDGRFTSGLFECFGLCDDEYVYGLKKIIEVIPLLKKEIIDIIEGFEKNRLEKHDKIGNSKEREKIAQCNYNKILEYLQKVQEVKYVRGNKE